MNQILVLVLMLFVLGTIFSFFKLYKKEGLYTLATILTITCLLYSFKFGNTFSFDTSITLPIYMGLLLIFYIFIDHFNINETKKLVNYTTFVSLIASLFIIFLALYIPSISDNVSANYKESVITNILSFASFNVCLFLTGHIIIKIYSALKKEFNNIFIDVSITCLITSLIDSIIFIAISFLFLKNKETSTYLIMANYIYKLMINSLYIPLLYYINKNIKRRGRK